MNMYVLFSNTSTRRYSELLNVPHDVKTLKKSSVFTEVVPEYTGFLKIFFSSRSNFSDNRVFIQKPENCSVAVRLPFLKVPALI